MIYKQTNCRKSDNILSINEPETYTVSKYCLPVSIEFRDWFLDYFNLIDKSGALTSQNEQLLRLAGYLLSCEGHRERDEKVEDITPIPIGQVLLREIMKPGTKDHNFSASKALCLFKMKMWEIEIREYDYHNQRTRAVTSQKLPLELRKRLKDELKRTAGPYVDLVTGEEHTTNEPKGTPSRVVAVEKLRNQLNSLDPEHFLPVRESIAEAKAFVDRQEWKEHTKLRELSLLRQLEICQKPHYKAVSGTTRIYSVGTSWLGLKRAVRNQLTESYWKLDLKSAQLRIAAALWNMDLEPYLENGSVWPYLLRAVGCRSHNKEMKDKLKTFIYSCLFGATQHTLRQRASDMNAPDLMKDPLVKEILRAREEFQNRLENGEELKDAWGRSMQVNEKGARARSKQVRSMMSAICQSYELKLLIPVIDHARSKGCETIAALHDGIFGTGDWSKFEDELKELVRSESKQLLGHEIELDIEGPKV